MGAIPLWVEFDNVFTLSAQSSIVTADWGGIWKLTLPEAGSMVWSKFSWIMCFVNLNKVWHLTDLWELKQTFLGHLMWAFLRRILFANLRCLKVLSFWWTRITKQHMKSFIAKRVNSILVNLRYLRFKLLKYKENNKKICNTFDHNFKKYSFIYNEKSIIRKVLFSIIRWWLCVTNFKNGA